jgi:ABC-type thiamine transport system substrate-binding protein
MNIQALGKVIWLSCGLVLASAGSILPADTKPTWQVNWEKTLAAAKKEARLNLYVGRYGTEPLLNEFRKEFPEIRLVTVNGTGNSLGTRILTELRAGNVVADLFSGGANTNYEILYEGKALDSIKSTLILPEVLDETKWYEGKHRYTDPEQRHIFVYIANPSSSGFYYNTTLVNPKEFKSYWDLVAPRWKGKYISQEPTSTGLGGGLQFMYYHPDLGAEFLKRLFRDMQPTLGRDRRQITKSQTGWLKEDMRFASAAARPTGPRARDCRSTSSITSTGRKVFNSLPAAGR